MGLEWEVRDGGLFGGVDGDLIWKWAFVWHWGWKCGVASIYTSENVILCN